MNKINVILQVSHEVAKTLNHHGKTSSESKDITNIIENLRVTLVPMYPETEDPVLNTYFIVEVPDFKVAEEIIVQLQRLPAIRAAYVKPFN